MGRTWTLLEREINKLSNGTRLSTNDNKGMTDQTQSSKLYLSLNVYYM